LENTEYENHDDEYLERLWIVVRSLKNSFGKVDYKIKKFDIIKLGRVRFKVKDFRCSKHHQSKEEILSEELREAVAVGTVYDSS